MEARRAVWWFWAVIWMDCRYVKKLHRKSLKELYMVTEAFVSEMDGGIEEHLRHPRKNRWVIQRVTVKYPFTLTRKPLPNATTGDDLFLLFLLFFSSSSLLLNSRAQYL